jgi:hypothetical protein
MPATDERYPIGKFELPATIDAATTKEWIDTIEALPGELAKAVAGLDAAQLATPYRDGGWTVRQVVHHVPDSHMNAYIRCKLDAPVEVSLQLLEALHRRWTLFLRSLNDVELERVLVHPVSGVHTIRSMCGLYAWHSRHHVAHITRLRERMGW